MAAESGCRPPAEPLLRNLKSSGTLVSHLEKHSSHTVSYYSFTTFLNLLPQFQGKKNEAQRFEGTVQGHVVKVEQGSSWHPIAERRAFCTAPFSHWEKLWGMDFWLNIWKFCLEQMGSLEWWEGYTGWLVLIELCLHGKVFWCFKSQFFRMWPYLEMGFYRRELG